MCADSRLLSTEMKWYIVHQVEDDKKDKEIIKNVKNKFGRVMEPCTILKLWDKYNETGDVVNNWGGGRPQLFNAKEQTNIVCVVRKKKSITGVDIQT
jgi:transposase